MEFSKIKRFGNVIHNVEFDKNIRLEKLLSRMEKVLTNNGFLKCHIPQVDYPSRFVGENDSEGINDLYKPIGGDGRILALPNEPTIALMNSLLLRRDEIARYFGETETYSFLKPINPQNGYYLTAVLTNANGYEAEAEMCGLAIELAESIGIKTPLKLGNTEIAQGVVDFYLQRTETRDKVRKISSGDVQSEGEFAAAQIFSDMKKINEASMMAYVQELSKKLDNKRSIDGVVDVYEVLNRLDAQNKMSEVSVDPLYVGEGDFASGMTFRLGEDAPVIFGGRQVYVNGGEAMGVVTLTVDLMQLASLLGTLPKEQPRKVEILVSDSFVAYQKSLKFKADFLKNGLVSYVSYKVSPEEADRRIAERNGNEYLVVYITEDGGLKHN